LVGLLGGEPDAGGLGPLGRLKDHQAGPARYRLIVAAETWI
jgi:hypothetical protein